MKKLLLIILLPCTLWAQPKDEQTLSLQEVIQMAREQSVSSLVAATQKETSYWQFRTYRSNLYPQLILEGTLPDFSRSFSPVTQPDGTLQFQPVVNSYSGVNLQLSQNIGLTGGQVFVNSQLQRFDDFERSITRYNGNPVSFGYKQSIFNFNKLRWDRQIEPLKYEKSRRKYLTDLEAVSLQTSSYFFSLLLAQMDYEMAEQNVQRGHQNLEIAKVRFQMGKISENDLLQIQYILLNAQNSLAQARQDMQTASLQLKAYIGLEKAYIKVKAPEELQDLLFDEALAVSEAQKNKETWLDFKIRLLEAQRNVNKAKKENGFNADLFATVGLANRANHFDQVYQNPVDQQTVKLGFTMPIIDWGRSKAVRQTAEAEQKLTNYTVKQDQVNFEQQIITQVALIQSLKIQTKIAKEAARLAQQRFRITGESFALGKISITELNIAQTEKDQAYRNYLQSLKSYWETYYRLRMLTLYDFQQQTPIIMQEN